ncbi:MAG: transglutaminase domain-containing protein [Verrucomicrobiota bacterium]
MSKLRQIPYRYSKQWQTPVEVSITRRADCKGKAMLLYEIMREKGVTDVRFIIGKRRASDWFTHAWLEWETADGTYLLDPTFNRRAVRMQRESREAYVPLFAYEGVLRYRVLNPTGPTEIPLRAVAAGKPSWPLFNLNNLE